MFYKLFFLQVFLLFFSCSFITDDNSKNIARYGESFLSKEELQSLIQGVKTNDSIPMVNSIINNWAIEKILIERAELNLNETKLQKIQSLADDYKSNLLSEAYLEALVNSTINLEVDSIEILNLYENNKSLFDLNEDIFKLVYVELPLDFSDTYLVRSKIKRFKRDDQIFLDSISFRFKSFSLTTEEWIAQNSLTQKFPFLTNYNYQSLKNYNFFNSKIL